MLLNAIPVLAAIDVTTALSFWVNELGFDEAFRTEGFAGIARAGVTLYICSVDDQLVADNTQAWIVVDDVEALHAEWSSRVSTRYEDTTEPALTAIVQQKWGREFAIRDVTGNGVHFVATGST